MKILELHTTLTKMKNSLFKRRSVQKHSLFKSVQKDILDNGRKFISKLEDKLFHLKNSIKKEWKTSNQRLRDLWENVECINAGIIRVPERKERDQGRQIIWQKIIVNHFTNMVKLNKLQTKKPRGINTWKHNSQSTEIQPQLEKSLKQPEKKWLILYKETISS